MGQSRIGWHAALALAVLAQAAGSTRAQGQGANRPPQPRVAAQPQPKGPAAAQAQLGTPQLNEKRPAQGKDADDDKAPKAPFVLTPSEQKLLDQVLKKWEDRSDKIKSFKCSFRRWDYDRAFGPNLKSLPPDKKYLKYEGQGEIKYRTPDHAVFEMTEQVAYVESPQDPSMPQQAPKIKTQKIPKDELEHWVCTGESIYEFNAKTTPKQVTEYPLPPELRGQGIVDGPVPFLFGTKADKLKKRYFIRDITPQSAIGKQIWLEAFPRWPQDALNFQRVVLILNEADFLPNAIQIELPGDDKDPSGERSRTSYAFNKPLINDKWEWFKKDFDPPATPRGWKHIVEKPRAPVPELPSAPPNKSSQAQRITAGQNRK